MTWTDTLRAFVPTELRDLPQLQTDLPRIAKDRRLLSAIEHAIQQIPTDGVGGAAGAVARHRLINELLND